jgi:hypothetical protein
MLMLAAALMASAPYQLTFAIANKVYVSRRDMSLRACRRVLRSTAHDPDSFRNGQGVYACRVQR